MHGVGHVSCGPAVQHDLAQNASTDVGKNCPNKVSPHVWFCVPCVLVRLVQSQSQHHWPKAVEVKAAENHEDQEDHEEDTQEDDLQGCQEGPGKKTTIFYEMNPNRCVCKKSSASTLTHHC